MRLQRLIRNQKGFAMVLAISMIGLLSLFGVWMLMESQTSFRVTASMERREMTFNLAEGALQLDYRCLTDNVPSPSYNQLNPAGDNETKIERESDVTPGLSYLAEEQTLGKGTTTPKIRYISYSPNAPPGWMLNWQGSSSFHSMYYRAKGKGRIALEKGAAQTNLSALMLRVTR